MQENEFPLKFFPLEFQKIILEVCSVYQFNPDFLAASILSVASTAIGNTFSMRVKEGWIEPPSLFLAIVASPGINKSAPLSWALRPIEQREKELYRQYKQVVKEFQEDEKNAGKLPPPLIKTIVSDATPEAIVQQLHKNERGLMIYNDELAGFLKTFQRYSKGNDEQFYLSVWSGKAVVVDRKTSTSIRISDPVLNIIGTIQPSIFDKIFSEKEDSGFFDRWLIVNPKNAKKEYWSDEDLRPEVPELYQKYINRLQDITFKYNDFDEPVSQQLSYSNEAWKLIKQWQYRNTNSINETEQEHIRAIRSKMEIYVHRFSVIAHLLIYCQADVHYIEHKITEDTAGCAIRLADYFIKTAMSARSGDQSGTLPDVWKKLYDTLPDQEVTFNTAEFFKYADFCDIPEHSAKRWLKTQEGKLITKIKHGTYAKK